MDSKPDRWTSMWSLVLDNLWSGSTDWPPLRPGFGPCFSPWLDPWFGPWMNWMDGLSIRFLQRHNIIQDFRLPKLFLNRPFEIARFVEEWEYQYQKFLYLYQSRIQLYKTIDPDHARLCARQSVFRRYFQAFHEFDLAVKIFIAITKIFISW